MNQGSQQSSLVRNVMLISAAVFIGLTGLLLITRQARLIPGMISGGVLASVNFLVIVAFVRKMIRADKTQKNLLPIFLFLGKFLFLGVAIFFLIAYVKISGLGLILGLTAVFISVLITGVVLRLRQR